MPSREILYGIGCSCPDRRTSLKRAGRVGRATVAWGSGLVNEPFGEEIAVPRPMERRRGRGRQARAGSHRSRRESARRLPRDGSETSRIARAPERTEAIGLVSRRTPFLLFWEDLSEPPISWTCATDWSSFESVTVARTP